MKIKVLLLDKDSRYLERLMAAFQKNYADKLEIYSFTNCEKALEVIHSEKINVFLSSLEYEIETTLIPGHCAFAYFVDSKDIEVYKDVKAICKFQTPDMLYKCILSLFSDVASDITKFSSLSADDCVVYDFVSASGGTGNSTAAAACAIHLAKAGKKVMYLNFERLGDPDLYFHAEGSETFRDIIFAVKNKKANLPLKLSSIVKTDASGVNYYATAPLALNIAELSILEIIEIIDALKNSGQYEYIIIDMDFSLEKDSLELMSRCNELVFVSDGSPISNSKLKRATDSLRIIEEEKEMVILKNTVILYNRFSSKVSSKIEISGIDEIGGIKRYEGYGESKLLEELSSLPVFDNFIIER